MDEKTCEKFGQSIKENVAFSLIIPTSKESRLVAVRVGNVGSAVENFGSMVEKVAARTYYSGDPNITCFNHEKDRKIVRNEEWRE